MKLQKKNHYHENSNFLSSIFVYQNNSGVLLHFKNARTQSTYRKRNQTRMASTLRPKWYDSLYRVHGFCLLYEFCSKSQRH